MLGLNTGGFMKSLMSLFTLLFSISTLAAAIEPGLYHAKDLIEAGIQAELDFKADGTMTFRIATEDFIMEKPGCSGNYSTEGDLLKAVVNCPNEDIENMSVVLDIKNVNPDAVRSEDGAQVDVVIELLGPDAIPFNVKKVDAPVLP